jgi:hypothetical protein
VYKISDDDDDDDSAVYFIKALGWWMDFHFSE